jgi:hypothetical protein
MQTDDDLGQRVSAYALSLDKGTEPISIDEIATRRAHGTRRRVRAVPIMVAAITAAVLLVAAVAVARSRTEAPIAAPAVSVRVATDTRSEIRDGHLSRAVLIDGGTLRLDPVSGTPSVTEAHAIALFRAGSQPGSSVSSVSVVYALVTLRLAADTDPARVIQPRSTPVFEHRAAWVIIWRDTGDFHGCLEGPEPGSSAPPRQSVELIAADGSGEALAYDTGGSQCGRTVGPHVAIASYYISLPWTVASRIGSRVVLRYPAPPACSDREDSPYATGPNSATFSVYAYVLMARPPCTTPKQGSTLVDSAPPNATLHHVKTGLSVGYFTPKPGHVIVDPAGSTFTYFDGATRTIR